MNSDQRTPVKFKGMVHDSQMNVYVLLFEGENPDLTLPVPIGLVEALHLQMLLSDNPMPQITPRLFYETLGKLGQTVEEMEILSEDLPLYKARVRLRHTESGTEQVLETRCSDGLMLAVQARCPLYIREHWLVARGLPLTDRIHKDDYLDLLLNKIKDELQDHASMMKTLYGTDFPLINERDGLVDEYDDGYADGYDDGYADGFDGYEGQGPAEDGGRDPHTAEADAEADRALEEQYQMILDHVIQEARPLDQVYPRYLRKRLRQDLEAMLPELLRSEDYEKAAVVHKLLEQKPRPGK